MGGKNSKPADAPPPPPVAAAEHKQPGAAGSDDDDPLAGTPFALGAQTSKPAAPAATTPSDAKPTTADNATPPPQPANPDGPSKPDTMLAPGEKSIYHERPEHAAHDMTTVDAAIARGYMPHYSKVIDPVETINPVTGKSIYYSARPWRCDDRFQDWFATFIKHRRWDKVSETWAVLRQCAKADYGEQPTVPYVSLERREIMYYVDRAEHDMIRDRFWQRYPWSQREPIRTMLEDGSRMRVWRHQREIELEAKEGRVEDLIAGANHGEVTYGRVDDLVADKSMPKAMPGRVH
uniref:Uncharacterized protein n=1 Tax=Neobodo designis TaxID=312471 RepID=A0A7S1MRQ5_NEODS|mmetsp:Transcript_44631/g.137741  ORF Transcript_44631/g.137741 Transcript_44631/m.137741 type:complete len:292 (+) Transcript_44631:35-910(+)